MTVVVNINAYRRPGISHAAFKDHYEKKHVPLLKSIAGDTFPLSHKRYYPDVNGPRTKERLIKGPASEFSMDAFTTLTFSDEAAFKRFFAKVSEPKAAEAIRKDENEFLDSDRLAIIILGDVQETTRSMTTAAAAGREGGSGGERGRAESGRRGTERGERSGTRGGERSSPSGRATRSPARG